MINSIIIDHTRKTSTFFKKIYFEVIQALNDMIFTIILAENLFHCLFLKKKLFWSSNSVQVDELKRTTLKKNRQTTKAQKQTRNNIVKLFCFKSSLHFQSFWTTFFK